MSKLNMIGDRPIRDAKKPIIITISKSDCARGVLKDAGKCPGALACKRVPGCAEARVHSAYTFLRFGNVWLRYHTPPSLHTELVCFDRGGRIQGGQFRLRPRSLAEQRRKNKPRGPHTKKRRDIKIHVLRDIRPHSRVNR